MILTVLKNHPYNPMALRFWINHYPYNVNLTINCSTPTPTVVLSQHSGWTCSSTTREKCKIGSKFWWMFEFYSHILVSLYFMYIPLITLAMEVIKQNTNHFAINLFIRFSLLKKLKLSPYKIDHHTQDIGFKSCRKIVPITYAICLPNQNLVIKKPLSVRKIIVNSENILK